MTYSTIAIIYNPVSTGSGEELAVDFKNALEKRLPKQTIELIPTKRARHAEELAYEIAKRSKNALVISSSGDGGYNEIVNGAMRAQNKGYKVTTSLLPAGNADDHYRNLNEENLVDLIVANKTRNIDLIKLTSTSNGKLVERYAHSYMGFGLTPEVSVELNKTKLNIFNEVILVARVLLTVRSVRLKIDNRIRRYESIVFSNVDQMSKYLKISQPSHMDDGEFEVTIFTRRHKLQLILLLLRASLLGVKEDMRVSSFSLETVDPTLVQADGEVLELDAGVAAEITAEKQILTTVI